MSTRDNRDLHSQSKRKRERDSTPDRILIHWKTRPTVSRKLTKSTLSDGINRDSRCNFTSHSFQLLPRCPLHPLPPLFYLLFQRFRPLRVQSISWFHSPLPVLRENRDKWERERNRERVRNNERDARPQAFRTKRLIPTHLIDPQVYCLLSTSLTNVVLNRPTLPSRRRHDVPYFFPTLVVVVSVIYASITKFPTCTRISRHFLVYSEKAREQKIQPRITSTDLNLSNSESYDSYVFINCNESHDTEFFIVSLVNSGFEWQRKLSHYLWQNSMKISCSATKNNQISFNFEIVRISAFFSIIELDSSTFGYSCRQLFAKRGI